MGDATRFDAADLNNIRKAVRDAVPYNVPGFEGPGVLDCGEEPMNIAAAFPCLSIKPGYVLYGYRYVSGGNGNGIVWAVPKDTPPLPWEALRRQCDDAEETDDLFVLYKAKPEGALDDFRAVFEGDGSPWSYLCASLLARELAEYGAMWHGSSWSVHQILGTKEDDAYDSRRWTWSEKKPEDFQPTVEMREQGPVVRFYTFYEVGQETINLFTDTYGPESYCFESDIETIATGGRGMKF